MRFAAIALAAALSSFASAQLTNQLPECAQTCFGNNYGGCQPLDIKCICANNDLISSISCCVFATCNDTDRDATIKFAYDLCVANQVTVNTQPVCSSTSAPAASGSSPAPASGSAASATATGAAASSAASAASASAAQTKSAGSTGAAAIHTAGPGIGLGLAMAGFVAAL